MPLSKARNRELMRQLRYNRRINGEVVVPKVEEKHQAIPTMADYGIQSLDADGQPIYEES